MRFFTRKHRGGAKAPSRNSKNRSRKSANAGAGKNAGPCGRYEDNEACLDHKIQELNFIRLESPDDGNCFFYSLETYFKLMEAPLATKDNMELRSMIVDYLLAHANKYLPFVMKEYSAKTKPEKAEALKLAYVKKGIEKLRKANVYDTEFGDVVPQEAPNAFNIKLIIHDWSWSEKRFRPVEAVPESGGSPLYTVNVLRINGNHFDLLFPKADFDEDKIGKWEMVKLMREGFNSNNNSA